MNHPADKGNVIIEKYAPQIFSMLSSLGRRIFFPSQGILAQSTQAKEKAHLYNATIGIATEKGKAMSLSTITEELNLDDVSYLTYAPSYGLKSLRDKWKDLQKEKNPNLATKSFSLPVVTNALTHGLYIAMELFTNAGNTVLLSDFYWGNYNLMLKHTLQYNLETFTLFTDTGEFNHESFQNSIRKEAQKSDVVRVALNFPNNPTGYSILKKDVPTVQNFLYSIAEEGNKIVVFCDDAYFGLFFEDDVEQQSMFAYLADLHPNILAVKIDGATKEDYVWGLRCGFVTCSYGNSSTEVYRELESKMAGVIRANISNCSHLSQQLVLKSLNSNNYQSQKGEKYVIMKERYLEVKQSLTKQEYTKYFRAYPYNSGYFMSIEVLFDKTADEVRLALLDKGIGLIALGEKTLRVAFSCLEKEYIADLFDKLYKTCKEMAG